MARTLRRYLPIPSCMQCVAKGAGSIYLAGNSYIVMERNLRGKVLTGKLNYNGDW